MRGITPLCKACASGHVALCRNVTRGSISAGVQTGFCRDTGGGWSESLVAHASQVYAVPEQLDNETAVMTEPFACALHSALRARPRDDQTVLVMGCGAVGILTIAAIRALGSTARIVAVAMYPHQAEHAGRLGANQVLMYQGRVSARYALLAEAFGAELYQPEIGKPTVVGGADVTFDCVASSTSIDDSVRFTTAGGTMILVGMPGIPSGIDWTSIWYKELSVHAAYAYGREEYDGRETTTFQLALDLLAKHGAAIRRLVGEPFALRDYREAVRAALPGGQTQSIKTVFRIQSE